MPSHRVCSRMHVDLPTNGVCPRCREIREDELTPVDPEPYVIEATVEGSSDYYPKGEWE